MKRLEVRLVTEPGIERTVGFLAESERRIYFEYSGEFLQDPLWLSPFKLPPDPGLHEHRDRSFGPVFGLFDDSLPDGWGLLLMDRFLQQAGWNLPEVSVMDRLAFLGTRTMGALTYYPPADSGVRDPHLLDLHEMARMSDEVMSGSVREVLPELMRAGGSPGGARPKVLVGVAGNSVISGEDDLPEGYEHWLIKFGGGQDVMESGPVEFAYAQMAGDAGIEMPSVRLFETDHDERFFGVKRFDRVGNRRFHIHTFGNLIHSNFRIPSCDYDQLLSVTKVLTKNYKDVLQCFRRMAFNVVTHNRDDHVKNFSFMMDNAGAWILAPAYDLVFAQGPGSEHTMTIAGEGKAPGRQHMLKLAEKAGLRLSDAEVVIDEVTAVASKWLDYASKVNLDRHSSTVTMIQREIQSSISRA